MGFDFSSGEYLEVSGALIGVVALALSWIGQSGPFSDLTVGVFFCQ